MHRPEERKTDMQPPQIQSSKFEVGSSMFAFPRSNALTLLTLLTLTLTGCSGPHPQRGGHASTTPATSGGIAQTLVQSDNPSHSSRQNQDTIRTRTYTLPPGSRIQQEPVPNVPSPQHSNTPTVSFVLSAPTLVTERDETHARTELGAAQKDTAREIGAKLSSLKGIVWVGVALFTFGIASFAWPPLRAIIGSLTTSLAITVGGIALMILPTLIVGNELLILGGVALAVGGWFLAHRHGEFRGQLNAASKPKTSPTK
jgi:hypothetical protein